MWKKKRQFWSFVTLLLIELAPLPSVCISSLFRHVWLFMSPWTTDHQAPLPMGLFRHECWSGSPFPPLADLPNPGLNPHLLYFLLWQVGSLSLAPPGKPISPLQHAWNVQGTLVAQIFPPNNYRVFCERSLALIASSPSPHKLFLPSLIWNGKTMRKITTVTFLQILHYSWEFSECCQLTNSASNAW